MTTVDDRKAATFPMKYTVAYVIATVVLNVLMARSRTPEGTRYPA